jgi:GTP cyclohydrolase I
MIPLYQSTATKVSDALTKEAKAFHEVSLEEAEAAVRTLLIWAGDDPNREGLVDTPSRVAKSYSEFFRGYETDPAALLSRTFDEVDGYNDIVLLRDITFQSHCEHHVVPIAGSAHVAYLPAERVVGISKLARVVDAYARRLQTQETMTAQIANCIEKTLLPRGVAVIVRAQHQCMTTRGVNKPNVAMVTRTFTGEFHDNPTMERRLMDLLNA